VRKPLEKYFPDYIYLFSLSGLALIIDQLSKSMVRSSLAFGDVWFPFESLDRYFRIVHWKNTGAAFGIFQNGNTIFLLLGIFVTLAIINFYPIIPRQDRWLRAALALQLGGAMGNLVDRILLSHVTDFISVMRFPVFNVADASIFIGVLLILVPFFPQMRSEIDSSKQLREAQEINKVYRNGEQKITRDEEPMTLGLIEVLWAETPTVERFTIQQDVRRIRYRNTNIKKGVSRG